MNCDIELKCYSRQKKELLRELKKSCLKLVVILEN